jgi:cobalt/nickel transport system permease protein
VTRRNAFLLVGLLVALVLAGLASGFASSSPDGLNRVAIDKGFADTEIEHDLADSPVAGYAVENVENERLSTGLAGVLGVGTTFAFGLGLFALVRRGRRAGDDAPTPTSVG